MRQTNLMKYYTDMRNAAIDKDIKGKEAFDRRIKVEQNPNNDTTIRKDIHAKIREGIIAGKSKKEIIESLNEERFFKYKDFFGSWIDDQFNKIDKTSKQISDEGR